jgi:Uma2 family endonuclease
MVAKKALLTADDLLRMTDDGMRHELIRGELRSMPPAGGEHGYVAGEILGHTREFVRQDQLGFVFAAETGFHIESDPDTVRAPDVAFVSTERLAGPAKGYPALAPDLAVEVVSPGDSRREVDAKARYWLRCGSRMVWVVFLSPRSARVYRPGQEAQVLTENDTIDGGDVLPGFSCRVADFFAGWPF